MENIEKSNNNICGDGKMYEKQVICEAAKNDEHFYELKNFMPHKYMCSIAKH